MAGQRLRKFRPFLLGPRGAQRGTAPPHPRGCQSRGGALERRLGLRYLMGMDPVALTALLRDINRVSPPKPELCARLGTIITAEPNAFNVDGGTNRFDQKPGYGFSTQTERESIYLLVFVVADLCREGLRPEYLRKLFRVYQEHPEFFGLPKRVPETSGPRV